MEAQIALEFLIVYSFVLILFILLFSIITLQRAATLQEQQYSSLQLQAEQIASYMQQAELAGSGYYATIPLVSGLDHNYYNISVSSAGAVVVSTKVGNQQLSAYAFSNVQGIIANNTNILRFRSVPLGDALLYTLPTYNGRITIANLRGTVYVDQPPPNMSKLPADERINVQSETKAMVFNASSYLEMPNFNPTSGDISISMYINPNSYGSDLISAQCSSNGYFIQLTSAGNPKFGVQCFSGDVYSPGIVLPLHTWSHVVATFRHSTGVVDIYVNGSLVGSGDIQGVALAGQTYYLGGGPDGTFNGMITNVQVYNSVLSGNEIGQLYDEGIGGNPPNYTNLVSWYPLDGNTRDYAAQDNFEIANPAANAINFMNVTQINAQVFTWTGAPAQNDIVGFSSNIGNFSGNSFASERTNANGIAIGYLTTKLLENAQPTVDVYSGGSALTANLIGWWPLNSENGSYVPDFSASSATGNFNGNLVAGENSTSFLAANFPGNPAGVSESNSMDGFITVNSSSSMLSDVVNNSFTVTAWIYYRGGTSNHWQGIFGDGGNSIGYGGFQFIADCQSGCTSPNNAVLYVGGNYITFPAGQNSFPSGKWEMATAQYNGNTGSAAVYLNGSLYASGTLPKNLNLVQLNPYYIGDDPSQPGGLDTFNGMITNVQYYGAYLSQKQINSLYSSGIYATPLAGSGLLGWWPLNGNARDNSANGNDGKLNYNVTYQNSGYNSSVGGKQLYASFNGMGAAVIVGNSPLFLEGNTFSVSAWVKEGGYGTGTGIDSIRTIFAESNGASNSFYFVSLQKGHLGLAEIDGNTGRVLVQTGSSTTISNNTWHQVVAVFQPGNGSIVGIPYIDGSYGGSESPFSVSWSFAGYNGIGPVMGGNCDTFSPEYPGNQILGGNCAIEQSFNGQIADVQVYNLALTKTEVEQLYEQGLPGQNVFNLSNG